MQTVWKYPIAAEDYNILEMPAGAQPLCVQTQDGQPALWALVNPEAGPEKRVFRLAGTGHPIKETNLQYIGSFQLYGGSFVGHLFEIVPFDLSDDAEFLAEGKLNPHYLPPTTEKAESEQP